VPLAYRRERTLKAGREISRDLAILFCEAITNPKCWQVLFGVVDETTRQHDIDIEKNNQSSKLDRALSNPEEK
jgi:hypothetical protein